MKKFERIWRDKYGMFHYWAETTWRPITKKELRDKKNIWLIWYNLIDEIGWQKYTLKALTRDVATFFRRVLHIAK